MTNPIKAIGRRRRAGAVVNQAILKIAQPCNLNCTYCYVYNRGDDSWRTRPALISDVVVRRLGERIQEHCEKHDLSGFTVEFHGGEPLLVGKPRMDRIVELLKQSCGRTLHFTLQTNGVLLDGDWIDLFEKHQISFGLSLDGPPRHADKFRIMRADGSGSTQRVLDTIAELRREKPAFEQLLGGCLCVVNPEIDGAALVDWFVAQRITSFDFLLPDGNRANFPDGWTGPEPYQRFLLSAFNRWYSLGDRAPRIRKFELMLAGLLGGDVFLDALGGDLRLLCVVESDGSIGVSDVTRLCGGEYSRDVVNIFDHPLDEHVSRYRVDEIQQVCRQCVECPYLEACGGGYLPHRFDGVGFDNPSIYCDALYALSARMSEVIREDMPAKLWTRGAESTVTHS